MITTEHYQYLKTSAPFKEFSVDQFDQIAPYINFHELAKGQIIFFEEDERDKLYFIKSGYIKIEKYDITDSFYYVDYIKESSLFPYGGLFTDDLHAYTATTITKVELFYIPVKLFEEKAMINKKQMLFISRKLSSLLRFHELRLRHMVTSSATQRVIQSLAILLTDHGQLIDDIMIIPFPISVIELSRLSGTTRETTSHVLQDLRKNKIIDYQKKQISYLKVDYFKKFLN